jgi:hypothetical protein
MVFYASERLAQCYELCSPDSEEQKEIDKRDEDWRITIIKGLSHPDLNKDCFADAFYYDCSELPEELQDRFYNDIYLCFAITTKGELVSKWIYRDDL